MLDDERGLYIMESFLSELEKIAEDGEIQQASLVKEETIDEVSEIKRIKDPKVTSPGQMFGVQFSKMKDGSAKMKPLILPVPGYTFKPELQRFVPDMNQPGWITTGQEMVARAKREGYIQAKKEEAMARLQQEATSFMDNQQPQPEQQIQPQPQQEQTPPAPPQAAQQAPQQAAQPQGQQQIQQ